VAIVKTPSCTETGRSSSCMPQWINDLEVARSNPLYARALSRLAPFARVVFVDRHGMGLSDRLAATDVPPLETLMEDLQIGRTVTGVRVRGHASQRERAPRRVGNRGAG
jgi:hypothetical protein